MTVGNELLLVLKDAYTYSCSCLIEKKKKTENVYVLLLCSLTNCCKQCNHFIAAFESTTLEQKA